MQTLPPSPEIPVQPRILALIAARGGSKRLPGKNIRHLGGKPLIAWTIELALRCACFCDVLVSTDDAEIAAVARRHGALVPWLRPEELASDTADSVDVALHAIDWYQEQHGELDGLALLQPTSPFRTEHTVTESLAVFLSGGRRSVVSVTPALSHPAWCFHLEESGIEPFMGWEAASARSQDLAPAFVTDGSIFLTTPEALRLHRSFISATTQAFIVRNPRETLDIDTEEDWGIAEHTISEKI